MRPYQKHCQQHDQRHQKGITLVELMIAMTLSLILIGGMIQIFSSTKRTFQVQQGLSNIQENARFTLDIIARDLRMAGFSGCSSDVRIANALAAPIYMGNLDLPIVGYETSGGSTYSSPTGVNWTDLPSDIRNLVATTPSGKTYSDIITLRRTSSAGIGLAEEMADATADIQLVNLSTFQYPESGDIVYLGDCNRGSIFQVTGITNADPAQNVVLKHAAGAGTPGNTSTSLFPEEGWSGEAGFDSDAALYNLSGTSVTYFVAPSVVDSNNCEVVLSLWRMAGDDAPQELIPGIESIDIQYGVDTTDNGVPNRYATANNIDLTVTRDDQGKTSVADNIVSVRVDLTVNSIENIDGQDPVNHTFSQTFKVRNLGS